MTHALIPPTATPMETLNQELALLNEKLISSGTEVTTAISQYKPTLLKTWWVVNPGQIDPFYSSFVNGYVEPDNTNHLIDFPSVFF